VKGRDEWWRTYERIVCGWSRVKKGKSRGKKEEGTVGIDGFSEQNEM